MSGWTRKEIVKQYDISIIIDRTSLDSKWDNHADSQGRWRHQRVKSSNKYKYII